MSAAGITKHTLAITFIKSPMGPDVLTVTISKRHTRMIIIRLSTGPNKNPEMTKRMSFGSYSRKGAAGIIGILMNAITMYAMAASIASVVIFLTVSFMIKFLSG